MSHHKFLLKHKMHHPLFWMLLMGIWFFLRKDDYPSAGMALQVTFIKVADLALLVYITNYVLLPRLFYRKRYVWFTVIFIAMILTSSLLKMQLLGRVTGNPLLLDFANNWKSRVYDNVIPHFFLVLAGAAIKLMFDYTEMQQRLAEIGREKAETELNFLKSQINPHFLFNSLNAVYFLISKENSEARDALHKFSDMLRYQLYEMNDDRIPIEKEIKYLRDYMDLQQLRKDEKYSVQFGHSAAVSGFSIEPLLLVPLVENAFKHISHNPERTNFVKVFIDRLNGEFRFSVENSRDPLYRSTESGGGIGLPNVKRRLELLYPGRHELRIVESDNSFLVNLNLKLS